MQRRRGSKDAEERRDAKDAKRKPQITQISTDFFCGICEICGFNHLIGVNLCQSVDNSAKGAKERKGRQG